MKKVIFAASLILFCLAFVFSQEKESEAIRLTLNDCLLKALGNNFDILVEAINPEISEFSIRESKEFFMPQLSFGFDNYNRNYPTNWYAQGEVINYKSNEYSIGLSQRMITGGQINLSLSNQISNSTQKLLIVNPTYSGNLSFEFTQPLLKGFGPKINRREIKIAQNQRDISLHNLKSTLIQKVYEVEAAYWSLVSAIESLKVNEYSLENSKERLEKTKEAARIGIKTAVDVLASETEVASWENRIISARSQVERSENRLMEIINLPADGAGRAKSVIPVDKPGVEKKEISFEEALKIAIEQRPEMARYQKMIENSALDVSYYKNQLLPQLDLRLQMWYLGQSGDKLIYENDDPYRGKIIGKIEKSWTDAFKDVFDFKYDNWFVTLNLSIPLQNIFSRAGLARANMEKEQKQLEMEKEKRSIYNDLLSGFKELKNNEKRLETSSLYRQLMEKKLQAEEERVRLGLATSEWLFQYQRDLASARTEEIQATIDYKVSVANLERIMGVNLKTKNLKFKEYDF
jgi:outer membrane protein TolC